MTVKFLDLEAQYRSIKHEVDRAVLSVLESSSFVLGPEVRKFEEEFAAAHGAAEAVAVNSGTSALHLALLAAGVEQGDEVITVAMTFTATAAAIAYIGAKPVLVDVDPDSFTMDAALVEEKITPKTKAILPVHLYGQPADLAPLLEIADRHGVPLIEDAAQAHIAEYGGRRVGAQGFVGAFSFYPGKNLGAYGEGGLALTNNPEAAERMRLLRDWGQRRKYDHEMLAYNYRMDAIQGAILRVKLRHLERWTEDRRRIAAAYQEQLGNLELRLATELPGRRHVYHIYSLFHPDRNRLRDHLAAKGIQTGMHYPVPLHLQRAYASLGHRDGDFPVSEQVAREQLSLPIYPEMTVEDVDAVCAGIREWLG